jgi:hypothetical protein
MVRFEAAARSACPSATRPPPLAPAAPTRPPGRFRLAWGAWKENRTAKTQSLSSGRPKAGPGGRKATRFAPGSRVHSVPSRLGVFALQPSGPAAAGHGVHRSIPMQVGASGRSPLRTSGPVISRWAWAPSIGFPKDPVRPHRSKGQPQRTPRSQRRRASRAQSAQSPFLRVLCALCGESLSRLAWGPSHGSACGCTGPPPSLCSRRAADC